MLLNTLSMSLIDGKIEVLVVWECAKQYQYDKLEWLTYVKIAYNSMREEIDDG